MSLSIIIPSYNGKEILKANLPSVIDACTHWSPDKKRWEVILVDDGSTDQTDTWVKENYPAVKVVKNHKNLRFARAVNRGVAESSGDIVVLLNNDVRPQKDFLLPIMPHFEDKEIFAVGCLEKNIENGKEILGGRGTGRFARGFLVHQRAVDQNKTNTLWVTAGSGAFRKSIWQKLGGFDPLFRPAYEEDRDLSYNALKSGYKIVFEPNSKVVHIHETSNLKTFGRTKIKIMSFKNQLLLVWKNISSSKLFIEHLFWLPYHLIITTLKSNGLFLIGFLGALNQLFEAVSSRRKAKKLWKLTDEQIFANFSQ